MEQARKELPEIEYATIPTPARTAPTRWSIVTEWVQFRALDLERLKREMKQPVVVDLRNIYRPEDMAANGFIYESVGRPPPEGEVRLTTVMPRELVPAIRDVLR